MARVVFPSALRSLAGGAESAEVEACSVGELISALDARFPGLGHELRSGMAVAVDGEILQDAWLEPLARESEVHFLPAIRGG
jgi:molybdopterin converting factor small subunit